MSERLKRLERVFKALGDATRLRILGLLLTGEVCVCHIHDSLGIPQPKASRHLAYLRRAGMVATRREGLWIYYRLADADEQTVKAIQQAVGHVLGHVPQVRKDAARLQKRIDCELPETGQPPVLCCCNPAAGRTVGRDTEA
jgi:ArsR family transcriptional regulator, arsenate/arsenite/antimonite-responsive transcriptional repressor